MKTWHTYKWMNGSSKGVFISSRMEREEDWEIGNGVLSLIKEKNPQVFLPIPEGTKLICYDTKKLCNIWQEKIKILTPTIVGRQFFWNSVSLISSGSALSFVTRHWRNAECRLKKKIDERQKKVFPKIFFSDENLKNCGIYLVIKNFCYLCSASVSDRNHFTEVKDENVNKNEK